MDYKAFCLIFFQEVHANQFQTAENITDFYGEMANTREVKEYHHAQKYIGEDLMDNLVGR